MFESIKVGRNIKKYRKKNHETQEQLGRVIGYGATTVANYESGFRSPDIQTLAIIASHYGIRIDDLVR